MGYCRLRACGFRHLHAYQACDKDREVELSGNSFCDSYIAGLKSYGNVSPKPMVERVVKLKYMRIGIACCWELGPPALNMNEAGCTS